MLVGVNTEFFGLWEPDDCVTDNGWDLERRISCQLVYHLLAIGTVFTPLLKSVSQLSNSAHPTLLCFSFEERE